MNEKNIQIKTYNKIKAKKILHTSGRTGGRHRALFGGKISGSPPDFIYFTGINLLTLA